MTTPTSTNISSFDMIGGDRDGRKIGGFCEWMGPTFHEWMAAGHQFNLSEAPPNGPGLTKGQQFQIGNCWELAPGVLEPDLIDRDQMWTFDPAGGTAVYQCLQIGENRPTLVLLQVYGPPSQAEGGKQAEVSDEIHKEDVKQELQAEA